MSALTHELGELLSNSKSLNLLLWSRYLNRPHSSGVKNVLRDVARARVLSSNPGWQGDYLLFADDVGAEWLAVHLTAKDEWRELVRILVQLVRDKHEFAEHSDGSQAWRIPVLEKRTCWTMNTRF